MIEVPARLDLVKQLPPGSIGAEIGVCKGHFSIQILNETSVAKLYLVDAWRARPDYVDPLWDADHEANLAECKRVLAGHADRWEIVRGDSWDVATRGPLPKLDFIYVDADHSRLGCFRDLLAWSRRLKPTGVILGHDYTDCEQAMMWNFGVIEAVKDFCVLEGWEMTKITTEEFASYQLERVAAWRGAEL